jgi:uncharacterized protein (TIGR03435 family)
MTLRITRKLDNSRKPFVTAVGLLAVSTTLLVGQVSPMQSHARSPSQTVSAATPAFEVASIRPDKDDSGTFKFGWFSPGAFTATGATVQSLIQEAYQVENTRVFGAPKWLKFDRFDIKAKAPGDAAEKLRKLDNIQQYEQRIALESCMLQTLLRDRFKLAFHRETKEFSMFALVIAKNGLKLHEAKPDDTYPNGIKDLEGRGHGHVMRMTRGQLVGQGIPISDLIHMLSQLGLGLTVVDKTGLTGKYDFTLQWTPEQSTPMFKGTEGGQPQADTSPLADASGPSLFSAIEEQLGLKLERQKGPVEVLVIDHVEKPSNN